MKNNDLIKKKSISLTEATHTRLMEVVGFLQSQRGINTTANQAIEALLHKWEANQAIEKLEEDQPGVLEQIFQKTGQ
jgi:hypothetical protein